MTHKFLQVAQKVKTMAAITKSDKDAIREESKEHLKGAKQQVVQEVKHKHVLTKFLHISRCIILAIHIFQLLHLDEAKG